MTGFSVPGARVVAGAAALAPMSFAAYFVARLDRSLRAYLRSVLTQGRQRIAAIGAAACLALLLFATIAPADWLPWLLGVAAVGGFAVRLLTVSESNAHVRSAGGGVPQDRVSLVLWWAVILSIAAAIALEIGATDSTWWLSVAALLLVFAAVGCLIVILRRKSARRKGFRGFRS
jgi:hypothetical protein